MYIYIYITLYPRICFSSLPPARNFSPMPSSPSPHLLANSLRSYNLPLPTPYTHICVYMYYNICASRRSLHIVYSGLWTSVSGWWAGGRSREWIDTAIAILIILYTIISERGLATLYAKLSLKTIRP